MNLAGRVAAAGSLTLVLAACAATPSEPVLGETRVLPTDSAGEATTAPVQLTSALDDPRHPAFPDPLIDLDDLLPGGPPPDGIPSIDYPLFQPVSEVNWLEDDEPVLALTIDGRTKAYPIRIITWHEIVNDRLAGVPVAVTYCPLCNSGVAFERTVSGQTTTFGVSGKLYADNLVMYDRLTESLWPQLTGQASVGTLTGTRLTSIPMGAVGWGQFREEHPDARVLTRSTGHDRDYRTNPYVGYDDPDSDPIFALPNDS